jgi:hypothetical protein
MQLTQERGIDRVEPDLKIQVMRACCDRNYTSRAAEHIRFVIGRFKQHSAEHKRRYFRGAILVVTDEDGEREAVECFDQPNIVRQVRLRRSRLGDLARSRATSDEFYEALYEMAETTLPLEEGLEDYAADSDEESPRRVRVDEVREKF